jgi:hypothetical protein
MPTGGSGCWDTPQNVELFSPVLLDLSCYPYQPMARDPIGRLTRSERWQFVGAGAYWLLIGVPALLLGLYGILTLLF